MSTKKIKHWEAAQIARKIADKAFDHLMQPFFNRRNLIGHKVYNELLGYVKADPAALLATNFATECDSVSIEVTNGKGGELVIRAATDGPYLIRCQGYTTLTLESESLFNEVADLYADMKPLEEKIDRLQNELQDQLLNKTATQAMKAWPEAADIIAKQLDINVRPMTIPLEQLLAKFLPALPAPKE